MSPLPHCHYRTVDADGAILCNRIKQGDRAINADLCRACPVAAIDCSLLRATLSLHSRPPIRVRYGNGKTEILPGEEPTLTMEQAACSEKIIPIASPRDCAGCHLRQSLAEPRISSRSRTQPAPSISRAAHIIQRPPRRAHPVIQLAAWLEKEKPAAPSVPQFFPTHTPHHASAGLAPMCEEKRVGWTD